MNKTIRSFAIALSFCLTCSCSDDFLDISNPNQVTADNFWKSEKDMDDAHRACYGSMLQQGVYAQWYDIVYELRSDLCWNESAWRDYANFSKFIYPSSNWETIRYVWNDHYKGISMFNKFLAHIDDPNIEFSDETKRKHYKGEIHFLRALYYFQLYHLYGRMPLITEPVTEVIFPENSTAEQAWAQIESDLMVALNSDLPAVRPDNELGLVTKGAVQAMLGKSYMQQHKWQQAYEMFDAIIKDGNYKLVSNFGDNFDKDHEFNSESVFEVVFTMDTKGDWSTYGSVNSISGCNTAQYFAPRDIGGHSDAQPNYFYLSSFSDKTVEGKEDPRKKASIFYYPTQKLYGKSYLLFSGASPTINVDRPAIWRIKYSNGTWRDYEDSASPINLRIIRYADILLMQAEALNNLGRTAEAYDYIQQVRDRSSIEDLKSKKPSMTKEQMQEQIEHERIVELGGESVRFFDIFRWGYLDDEAGKAKLLEHDYEFASFRPGIDKFLPIPQNEIDLNPNFTPNVGW